MHRLLIFLLVFVSLLASAPVLQAGSAPLHPVPLQVSERGGLSSEISAEAIAPAPKAKWRQKLGQRWKRFIQADAKKYFRAFLLFVVIGTALYLAGTFILAGTLLGGVITTTTLAELISGGLYIGAYICYLYSLYTGIAALVTWILGMADMD